MRQNTTSPAMGFLLAQLTNDPTTDFRTVKERAALEGLTVYPVMYGNAKAMLGLVPRKKRTGRKAKAESPPPAPPRSARAHGNGSVGDFEDRFTRAITDIQARATTDSGRLRDAMRRAIEILEAALEG